MTFKLLALAGLAASVAPSCALASEEAAPAIWLDAAYTAEVAGPVSGGVSRRGVYLDDLTVEIGADLARLGWKGASLHATILNNSGGAPNAYAATLEGTSNIEVARPRLKLFELYLDQRFASDRGSLVLGYLDLNRDFYASDAAGLLMAPPFGIGTELAVTGPNGPSIFPSTALGARVLYGEEAWYLEAAAFDARANVLGDPGDISGDFEEGALLIAEAGLTGGGKTAIGLWGYTDERDDTRELAPSGDPAQSRAYGLYALIEQRVAGGDEGRRTDAFLRAGVSDGDTSDFSGSAQAGFLVSHLLAGRPQSQASLGLRYAALSSKARENARDAGGDPASGEFGIELTVSDNLTDWLSIQPGVQYIVHPGGEETADDVIYLGLRATVSFHAERG